MVGTGYQDKLHTSVEVVPGRVRRELTGMLRAAAAPTPVLSWESHSKCGTVWRRNGLLCSVLARLLESIFGGAPSDARLKYYEPRPKY